MRKAKAEKTGEFCTLLGGMLKDEVKARDREYPNLLKSMNRTNLPAYVKDGFTDIVNGIRKQEGSHFQTLNTVFNAICKRVDVSE